MYLRILIWSSCVLTLLLAACQSSLNVDAKRTARALDPPPSTGINYIKPESVTLSLSRRDIQNGAMISYPTQNSSINVAIDTSSVPVRIRASVQCPVLDTISIPGNSTFVFVLSHVYFRLDSVVASGIISLQGTPLKETGCALELLRYHIGFPTVDTMFIYPPDKPASTFSSASMTLATSYNKDIERYEIHGNLNFAVSVYDEFLHQTFSLPITGELLIRYQ